MINSQKPDSGDSPVRSLTLLDSVCIIVGTIIGAGIFGATPDVAGTAGGHVSLLLLWLFGGTIAMTGALCFAELMTRFPLAIGGDYVYLKRAFGLRVGFLFAWAAFWIVRPGNIGAMAMIFAQYFVKLTGSGDDFGVLFAVLAILGLSVINLLGLRAGKRVQNVLTIAKVVGIGSIVAVALVKNPGPATPVRVDAVSVQATVADVDAAASGTETSVVDSPEGTVAGDQIEKEAVVKESKWTEKLGRFWIAMVIIMFAYGGWNDIAFVSGEVREPKKNLLRSIVIGVVAVTAVYLAVTWAFLHVLGIAGVSGSKGVATDFMLTAFGPGTAIGARSSQLVAALICISCLGAMNGMILTSPRIYYSLGRDIKPLGFLAKLNQQRDSPWQSVVVQAVITIALTLLCLLYENALEAIIHVTAPYFWGLLGLTVMTLLVFRQREKAEGAEQDSIAKSALQVEIFRVPLFPIPVLLFAAACFAMVWASIAHAIRQGYSNAALLVLGLMVAGVIAGFILGSKRFRTDD